MKEIYLDEKQIEEVVIKYLDNHTYNYALMIDGSWGTGKTFFVKNDLIPLIEKIKKRVIQKIKFFMFPCMASNRVKKYRDCYMLSYVTK